MIQESILDEDTNEREKFRKKERKIARNIGKLNDKIEKKVQKYIDEEEDIETNSEIVNAYVTFKSMEGKERALQAYISNSKVYRLLNCCKKEDFEEKKFLGRFL